MNYYTAKNNYSKYIYKINKSDTQTYIFELLLNDKEYNSNIIRCIKNTNHGNIVTSDDNILYKNIDNYKLSIMNTINPENIIIVNEYIDHELLHNIYINNNIYLKINNKDNLLNMNYNIII